MKIGLGLLSVILILPMSSFSQEGPILPDSLSYSLIEISLYQRAVIGKNGIKGYVLDANYQKMPEAERAIQRAYYDSCYQALSNELVLKRKTSGGSYSDTMYIHKLKKDSLYYLKRKRNMTWFDTYYPSGK